ncbi:MAG: mitochondrial fission ELM1-domain-containing protein [Piptocephalis tieghemiana]|nr:MAG: mitochondrial fission ELM1-domain-containing protein [Piptocephalis tieghemiana]
MFFPLRLARGPLDHQLRARYPSVLFSSPGRPWCRNVSSISERPTAWILVEKGDRPGQRKAHALATALGDPQPHILTIDPAATTNWPKSFIYWFYRAWARLARPKATERPWGTGLTLASIPSPFPSYLISTDPSTYPATFALAALAKDASWTVATQYPDLPFAYFNSVILPHHDLRKLAKLGPTASQQKNMILTKGVLHGVSKGSLQRPSQSSTAIPPALLHRLSQNSRKGSEETFGFFIGHPTPSCRWSTKDAELLASEMLRLSKEWGHRLLVEFSDKTPALWKKGILKVLSSDPGIQKNIWVWDGRGKDPHLEILSLADRFVVTADDPTTLSEALTMAKPTYIFAPERCSNGPIKDFHRFLRASGNARRFRLVNALDRESVTDPYAGIGTWPAWSPFLPLSNKNPELLMERRMRNQVIQ